MLNVITLILTPIVAAIVAVCVGHWLHYSTARREDKISILKVFMGHRREFRDVLTKPISEEANKEFVLAMNLIPLVFYGSNVVLKAMKEYTDTFPDESRDKVEDAMGWLTGENAKKIDEYKEALEKFIMAMAKETGYKKIHFSL